MKILPKNLFWQNITGKLSGWWLVNGNTKQNGLIKRSRHHNHAKFSNWRQSSTKMSLFSHNVEKPAIDVKVFEQLIGSALPNEMSYQGFISSHLQHESIDAQSAAQVKRQLAVQKMLALVSATIADIKAIELNNISKNKG